MMIFCPFSLIIKPKTKGERSSQSQSHSSHIIFRWFCIGIDATFYQLLSFEDVIRAKWSQTNLFHNVMLLMKMNKKRTEKKKKKNEKNTSKIAVDICFLFLSTIDCFYYKIPFQMCAYQVIVCVCDIFLIVIHFIVLHIFYYLNDINIDLKFTISFDNHLQ